MGERDRCGGLRLGAAARARVAGSARGDGERRYTRAALYHTHTYTHTHTYLDIDQERCVCTRHLSRPKRDHGVVSLL
jgi:hypothetical protein